MAEWATRADVEEAAANWSEAVITCRLRKHKWNPLTATHDRYGWSVRERCSRRCGCEQTYDIDNRGYASKPKIVYPKDTEYLLKGKGRVTADGQAALRLLWVKGLKMLKEVES